MTSWNGQADMRAYMSEGAHRVTMPFLLEWCDETSVVHWQQEDDALPDWPEADRRMRQDGRPSRVRNPGPDHAALAYREPRVALVGSIRPRSIPSQSPDR